MTNAKTQAKQILADDYNVDFELDGGGGYSSTEPYPVAAAREMVATLERAGIESSYAPDHEDHSVAWIYLGPVGR